MDTKSLIKKIIKSERQKYDSIIQNKELSLLHHIELLDELRKENNKLERELLNAHKEIKRLKHENTNTRVD